MEIFEKNQFYRPAPLVDLEEISEKFPQNEETEPNKKIRIYSDGIFDLFHQGHSRQLCQAKNLFRNVHLIVGVINDKDTKSKKGEPIMSENERYEAVRHCKYADEVMKNAPWIIDEYFLIKHRIDYVCHDDLPYIDKEGNDIYKLLRERGMFITTQRTEGVSTSDIICRVIRNYDLYVRRNLERGYTAEDLNISQFLKNKLYFEKKFKKLNLKFGIWSNQIKETFIGFMWNLRSWLRTNHLEANKQQ